MTFEFINLKENFNQKEIQYNYSLENLERLNEDLKAKLDEKTLHLNQQFETYKKYVVSLFLKTFLFIANSKFIYIFIIKSMTVIIILKKWMKR